jgi:hypothetical protein
LLRANERSANFRSLRKTMVASPCPKSSTDIASADYAR